MENGPTPHADGISAFTWSQDWEQGTYLTAGETLAEITIPAPEWAWALRGPN